MLVFSCVIFVKINNQENQCKIFMFIRCEHWSLLLLFSLLNVFRLSRLPSVIKRLSQAFCNVLFTNLQSFNERFSFSSVLSDILVTLLLANNVELVNELFSVI